MIKRSFLGLARPKLAYTVLPDGSAGSMEEVPSPKKAVFFIPGAYAGPGECAVKLGDAVKRGQRFSQSGNGGPCAVSTVAGEVAQIKPYTDAKGQAFTAVTVTVGGQEEWDEGFPQSPDLQSALNYLENGPGGLSLAAFADADRPIKTIVVMGMDSDILVSAGQALVQDKAGLLAKGVQILKDITGVGKVVMAVPGALEGKAKDAGCEARVLDPQYPGALPALVMKKALGLTLPAGQEPEDLGVTFLSAEAVISLGQAFENKEGYGYKALTVISKEEKTTNIRARVGTPIGDVLAAASVTAGAGDRVVLGGPMRGSATFSLDLPVEPDTDAILVQDAGSLPDISDNACTNCGECVRACPAKIPVNILVRHLENGLYEEAAASFGLRSCVECGLCSYVCIAHIPVFQYIRLGKQELSRAEAQE